jgi:aminocarboxymuconate-semialdehyde decarboxylase
LLIDLHVHQLSAAMLNQDPRWGPFWENGALRVGGWTLGNRAYLPSEFEGIYEMMFSPEARRAAMDDCGIDQFIFSLPFHLVMYHTDPVFAERFARVVNDEFGAYCAIDPTRFGFWAHVPLQDPVAAAQELERAVVELGAKGMSMGAANFGGIEVDDEAMYPVWEKVSELGVPVFVHGYNQSVNQPEDWDGEVVIDRYDTSSILGMNSDEALFYWYITCGGVLDAFPDMKIVITHGGGFIPFQLRRFQETNKTMAKDSKNKQELSAYNSNFFFDLDIHSPFMRRAIVQEVGVEQVVYGDNFGGSDSHSGDLTEDMELSDADREKIRSGNVLKLLTR